MLVLICPAPDSAAEPVPPVKRKQHPNETTSSKKVHQKIKTPINQVYIYMVPCKLFNLFLDLNFFGTLISQRLWVSDFPKSDSSAKETMARTVLSPSPATATCLTIMFQSLNFFALQKLLFLTVILHGMFCGGLQDLVSYKLVCVYTYIHIYI